MDKEALFDLIAAKLDAEDIMDILGWETIELVEAIGDHILEYRQEFEEAVE